MWTISYKGAFIHGYCDKQECRWMTADYSAGGHTKSLLAAKMAITRNQRKSA